MRSVNLLPSGSAVRNRPPPPFFKSAKADFFICVDILFDMTKKSKIIDQILKKHLEYLLFRNKKTYYIRSR
jgi:regulator of RNase E activity RraB